MTTITREWAAAALGIKLPAKVTLDQLSDYQQERIRCAMRGAAAARKNDEPTLHAGYVLSNCVFNLAQRKPGEPLTETDLAALDKSRRDWDAARSAHLQAKSTGATDV